MLQSVRPNHRLFPRLYFPRFYTYIFIYILYIFFIFIFSETLYIYFHKYISYIFIIFIFSETLKSKWDSNWFQGPGCGHIWPLIGTLLASITHKNSSKIEFLTFQSVLYWHYWISNVYFCNRIQRSYEQK